MIQLDDEAENWTATLRQKALSGRGWTGSYVEWQAAFSRLRSDPLSVGQTEPTDADIDAAKKRG